MIFTNGILLDEKKLVELADLGVTQIVLHIDKYQSRDSAADQKEINKLKDEYCKLFRRIRRISLGFIEPIYDVSDLEEILIFYKQNKDIVSLIDFTVATETYDAEINKNNHKVNLELVCKKINEIYGVQYSAGMGRFLSDDFTWVCGTLVFSGDNLLGSIDKEVVQFIHESYYKKNKRYIFIGNHYPINFRSILMFFTNKSLRKIAGNYLKQKCKGKIYFQVILTIIPPELGQDKFNICRSCPDAMYYKGKLIPSCLLGRIERGMGENYKYYLEDYE